MNKIPYKVRVGFGIGLFLWSIGAIIATIIFSQRGLGVWVLIVGPIEDNFYLDPVTYSAKYKYCLQ